MTEYDCYACHGLGGPFIPTMEALSAFLNAETGMLFKIVGGVDPRIGEPLIRGQVEEGYRAGKRLVWVGHSLGAALGFYLNYPAALVVTIDPTDWGSNIDCQSEWELEPPYPGKWRATMGVDKWINFHQTQYPGGGVLSNPSPSKVDHFFPDTDHISIANDPRVRQIILEAMRKLK